MNLFAIWMTTVFCVMAEMVYEGMELNLSIMKIE